jgi:hypothetical protein
VARTARPIAARGLTSGLPRVGERLSKGRAQVRALSFSLIRRCRSLASRTPPHVRTTPRSGYRGTVALSGERPSSIFFRQGDCRASPWLPQRAFYQFGPEDDGYIGWTEEGPRDRMLGLIEDGDLFVIYGASSAETEKSHRNRVLGFLQVEARAIKDVDKASTGGMQRKRANGWQDKWTYAIPVVRAWRSNESILLERIAPKTYRPEAGQAIAVWNPPLLPEEVEMALKIKVREVSVFGEPIVVTTGSDNSPLGQALTSKIMTLGWRLEAAE